jgi:uncharacterized low-complexity protein
MSEKSKSLKSILYTGSIVAGSLLAVNTASAHQVSPFSFTDLGSGSQLRTVLLNNLASQKYNFDLSCGEKNKDSKSNDSKSKDGKCGDKKDSSMTQTKDVKKMDSKSKDGKCGEGKCGDSKSSDKKDSDKK